MDRELEDVGDLLVGRCLYSTQQTQRKLVSIRVAEQREVATAEPDLGCKVVQTVWWSVNGTARLLWTLYAR